MGKIADIARTLALGEQHKRQMLNLDAEFEEMQTERDRLKTENQNLKAQVKPLEEKVKRLEQRVEEEAAKAAKAEKLAASPSHKLEQSEIEVMKFIGNARSVTASDLGTGMKLHSVAVEHYLGRLFKSGHLEQSQVPLIGAMYSLSDKGNAYLMENGLVPGFGTKGGTEQPNNPKGHSCDHCGSTKLKRTGSRPDPTFGDVGIKQALYSCLDCGKQSGFTDDK